MGFGPVYPTGSKDDAGPVSGLDGLRRTVIETPLPVIAIGGIDETNAADVMKAGTYGIAVISSVCCREEPIRAARRLREMVYANVL